MGSYIPSTGEERQAMLQAIGLTSTDPLFDVVPESVRVKSLDLPEGLSELEVGQKMAELAAKNRVFPSVFRGAGAYRHYIPSIVKTVTSKEEFLTAYTPYQAEISQGVLQSIFEYQTQMCELTGMDVSNASVYDGAVAAAEAVSDRTGAVVLLKGADTVVTSGSGSTYINTTGNPGMATGGSGDVLTGVITALAASGIAPLDAARAGAFVHGMAGDLAAGKLGQWGMTATDIRDQLPVTLRGIVGK